MRDDQLMEDLILGNFKIKNFVLISKYFTMMKTILLPWLMDEGKQIKLNRPEAFIQTLWFKFCMGNVLKTNLVLFTELHPTSSS